MFPCSDAVGTLSCCNSLRWFSTMNMLGMRLTLERQAGYTGANKGQAYLIDLKQFTGFEQLVHV